MTFEGSKGGSELSARRRAVCDFQTRCMKRLTLLSAASSAAPYLNSFKNRSYTLNFFLFPAPVASLILTSPFSPTSGAFFLSFLRSVSALERRAPRSAPAERNEV